MAVYKVRMPAGHQGSYKVRMPTGHQGSYKVRMLGTEQITVDMTGAPVGASWTVRNSASAVIATGVTTQFLQQPYDSYTITWEDTAFPWVPPAPEGPIALLPTQPIDFNLI